MKMPWNRLFRRKSESATELREDYPTDTASEFTDDERMCEEWRRHIEATSGGGGGGGGGDDKREEEDWEYVSEYNVSFSSDEDIIDAYKENGGHGKRGDREFEDIVKHAAHQESSYNDRGKKEIKKHTLGPPTIDARHLSTMSPNVSKRRESRSTMPLKEKIMTFEQGVAGKRRGSCYPSMAEKTSCEDLNRFATWNSNTANGKKRNRKTPKQRRRARDSIPEYSEDESKFMVNMSLDELNDIIKKNVSSAMKTITSVTTKGRTNGVVQISPNDSFSTETETMFSGSSSHSSELPHGILSKQMKAQLDRDMLRGNRRMSHATIITPDSLESSLRAQAQAQNVAHFNTNQYPTTHTIQGLHQSAYGNTQQPDVQLSPYLNVMRNAPNPMPPPAPPPPPQIPQVTFNLPGAGYPTMDPNHHRSSLGMNDELVSPLDGIPQAALSRLQTRRHTLASLGSEGLLPGLNDNLESKLEQVSKAIRLLDTNISLGDGVGNKTEQLDDITQKSTESKTQTNNASFSGAGTVTSTGDVTQSPSVVAPILSIADQIKALSKKKPKKELKPGQIEMAGWVRGLLIFTNIVFLISGCGLVGLGIWMMADPKIETYFAVLNVDKNSSDFKMICYALIGVGSIITFISSMGCCGGIRSSKCMLSMFIVMVGVISIAQAGLGAVVILNQDSPSAIPILSSIFAEMESNLLSKMTQSVVEKYAPDTLIGTTWDSIQISLECCGASGPDDYKISAWKNDTANELTIPDTCCKLVSKEAEIPEPSNKLLCQMGTTGFLHDTGCYDMMIGWFKDNSKYILAGGITTLCIEVFSFIFALVICRKAHRDEERKKKSKQNNIPVQPS